MTLKEQKELKPSYDQLSPLLISGDTKAAMDDFIAYLQAIRLSPRWYANNAYNVKFKGKILFRFSMHNNRLDLYFTVANTSDIDRVISSLPNDMEKFYFKNLRKCTGCNPAHGKGKRFVILGNEYWGCAEPEIFFRNPTKDDLQCLIRFIPVRKENIQMHAK